MSNTSKMLFVIGGEKCGSTWLQHVLDTNDQFYLPPLVQEPQYFSYHYNRGVTYYDNLYKGATDAQIKVDVTPSYLSDIEAFRRIKKFVDSRNLDAKFVLICREPVDRLLSAYQMIQRKEHFKPLKSELETGSYIKNSSYSIHIERLLGYFSRDQLLIVFYDDMVNRPEHFLDQVATFSGLLKGSIINTYADVRINAGGLRKSKLIGQFYFVSGSILRKLRLIKLLHWIKKSKFIQFINKKNKKEFRLPEQDQQLIAELKPTFREGVHKLAILSGQEWIIDKWGYR